MFGNRVRYHRFNPLGGWNKRVDAAAAGESIASQKEIHRARFATIAAAYKQLFALVGLKKKTRKFESFAEYLAVAGIKEADVKPLAARRTKQARLYWLSAAFPLLLALFHAWTRHLGFCLANLVVAGFLGYVGLLHGLEAWRLRNRTLASLKTWLWGR